MPKRLIVNCVIACWVPAAAMACEGYARLSFNAPAVLEGILKSGEGNHEAQGAFDYVYIVLDKPVCVDARPVEAGGDDAAQSVEAPVTQIQIAGDAVDTQLPIGNRISVEGTLFPAHTMWHVEDVLIDAAGVTQRQLRRVRPSGASWLCARVCGLARGRSRHRWRCLPRMPPAD